MNRRSFFRGLACAALAGAARLYAPSTLSSPWLLVDSTPNVTNWFWEMWRREEAHSHLIRRQLSSPRQTGG